MKRVSSSNSLASTKSLSSHNSFSDLLGSSISTLTLGVTAVGAGVNAVVGATIGGVSHNSSRTKLQHPQEKGISTELCMSDFKAFLCHTLAKEVVNSDHLDPLYALLDVSSLVQEDYQEMELALLTVLKSNPTLPSKVVGQVHTFLGMVYLELDNNTKAVEAFLRAIWFISRNPEDETAIAQANHRLGLAYGRNKEYQQAINLLDRAIAGYDPTGPCYVLAKEDRHEVMEAQQLDLLAKSGRVSKAVVDKNAKSKRESRRKRVSQQDGGMKRSSSFNKSLTAAMTAFGGPGSNKNKGFVIKRQSTAELASIARSGSSEFDRPTMRRQASAAALF